MNSEWFEKMMLRDFEQTGRGLVVKSAALDNQLVGFGKKPNDGNFADLMWYSAAELAWLIHGKETQAGVRLIHAVKKHGFEIKKIIQGGNSE